jgi:hypothetical protein
MSLALAGILGALWGLTIWGRYWDVLPRSPDPAFGRIYPFSMRGVTVYETLQERTYLNDIWNLSSGAFYTGFALALAYKWKSDKLEKHFRAKMNRTGQPNL